MDEHLGGRIGRRLRLLVEKAHPPDAVRDARGRKLLAQPGHISRRRSKVASDDQMQVWVAESKPSQYFGDILDSLERHDATDEKHDAGAFGDGVLPAECTGGGIISDDGRRDAVRDNVDGSGHAEFDQVTTLRFGEGKEAGGGVEVRSLEGGDVKALLQRLPAPPAKPDRRQGPMRMIESPVAAAASGPADLQVQWVVRGVSMQDGVTREFRDGLLETIGLRQPQSGARHEIADRQAFGIFGRTRADRVRRPDLDVGAELALSGSELVHHLLHASGIGAGHAFVDDVTNRGHQLSGAP